MFEKNIYINHNYNKNQIKQVLLENNQYDQIPTPAQGEDKGLIYYDIKLDRILVWDGYVWKTVSYLDDIKPFSGDIQLELIWSQSNLIPGTAVATSSTVTTKVTDLELEFIPNTWAFKIPNNDDVIPYDIYGNGYKPIVKDSNGNVLPDGTLPGTSSIGNFNGWRLENNILTFYNGLSLTGSHIVDATHLPKLTYWKYTGSKGNISTSTYGTYIYEETSPSAPYNQIPLPLGKTAGSIASITVNGLLVYDWTFSSGEIILDENLLEYDIDDEDRVKIEIKI